MGESYVEFADFVEARSKALLRTAYLLTGDHHQAEDLLQSALTSLYLHWNGLRERHAAEAYVRRSLVTAYTSWWRRRSSRELPLAEIPDVEAGTPARPGGKDELWRHLSALPRQQRAVVVLRFYEDLSVEETAAMLGISAGSVKSHTSRAIASLRMRLGTVGTRAESASSGGAS